MCGSPSPDDIAKITDQPACSFSPDLIIAQLNTPSRSRIRRPRFPRLVRETHICTTRALAHSGDYLLTSFPKHARIWRMKEACTRRNLARVDTLVEEWLAMPEPDPLRGPVGYEMGALEPLFYYAI